MPLQPRSEPERPDARPRWEQRSAARVLESTGDRVLERSRRLVRAAAELLAENGLDGITLRAVLDRSGLSRRAFYERFHGKDELLLAVFEETMRTAADGFAAEIGSIEDPIERIRFVVEQMTARSRSDQMMRHSIALSREHLRLADERPQELQHALEPINRLIADQLREGMRRGVVRTDDADQLARMILNFVSSMVHTTLLGSPEGADLEVTEGVWEFCRRAIAA